MDARERCVKALWVCWDLAKLAPSTGWLIMCCFAIPSYASIGWVTPVVCAVFSSLLALCATYDIFLFLSPTVYTLIGGDDAKTNLTQSRAKCKAAVASLFFVASALMCVLFLVVAYTVIAPEERDQPCDGECEDCVEDRNCKAWVRGVEKKHDIVAICPPTKGSAKTDATFSCLADGWWMLVTSLIGGVWLVAAYCIVRKAGRGADGARDGGATELV